jgi:hypothetical protein
LCPNNGELLRNEADEIADHEDFDAWTFAEWGADLLKYDNCYMVPDQEVGSSPEFANPTYHQKMGASLANLQREIQYNVCQWGNGIDVGHWCVPVQLECTLLTIFKGIEGCKLVQDQRRYPKGLGQHLAYREPSNSLP